MNHDIRNVPPRNVAEKPHIIVIGNEKGGSGKSTTAMHLAIGLMQTGQRVGVLDIDTRQGTLRRFLDNRRAYAKDSNKEIPIPEYIELAVGRPNVPPDDAITRTLAVAAKTVDVLIVDTPGSAQPLSEVAHARADTLITPMNDSFIDLDVLVRVDPKTLMIERPSHYAEMVWKQKIARAQHDNGSMDWIVMRNRLSTLDSHNRQEVGRLLGEFAKRVGFRVIPGFGERVIYRELFLIGLTIMDIRETTAGLTMSQVAARQEVRQLIESLGVLAPPAPASAPD